MKTPAEVYVYSTRPYPGMPELTYRCATKIPAAFGRICMYRKRINLSHVLAGQRVGSKEVDQGIWIVSFMHYDLGFFDHEPVGSNRSTTRSSQKCCLCLRYKPLPMSPE